ncbi:MAG: glycoside hydrolase family 5 protein [Fibrella sp.]|nr:glycoside hydrolase family 5 protein [Armatimonadota bacterium]
MAGSLTALGSTPETTAALAPAARKWRGVNLGGWLVLEKWMTPSVFAGVDAGDEWTFCQKLGKAAATARIKKHRDNWIKDSDFAWIAARGLNAVRLPVGYWIAEEAPPYVSGWDTVERAFRLAKKHGLGVLLDLHGAPGSQNGMDHSGHSGELGWHGSRSNINHTLRVLENLALRCKGFDNLLGIELLNEPRWDVPMDVIKQFYRDAYPRVRKHLRADRAVVIHDAFRSGEWADGFGKTGMTNLILDTHLYQCYTDDDRKRDMHAQVELAVLGRKRQLDNMQKHLPVIVAEWSCGLPPESLRGLDGFERDTAMRAYGDAQLLSYETTRGWFFWNYHIESGGGWSFRDCVKRGWLPSRYS